MLSPARVTELVAHVARSCNVPIEARQLLVKVGREHIHRIPLALMLEHVCRYRSNLRPRSISARCSIIRSLARATRATPTC